MIGLVSSLVGFTSYAMIPPFNKLFNYGELGLLVVIIYCALASLLCCFMLCCSTTWSLPNKRRSVLTAHVVFFVFMATCVYSFYVDKTQRNTKGDKTLNLVSCGSFSLVSLSVSRLSELGFETGVFNFFLGSLMVAVMKWNLVFALGAAAFCYILITIRTYSDPHSEMENTRQQETLEMENMDTTLVETEIDIEKEEENLETQLIEINRLPCNDLYCPNCSKCIERTILLKPKRKLFRQQV
ncbi:uncharacterized protein LOC109801168 [Cajanus cajan]|nr:uncharacterized protein LOC109801168 [Cajanus cajan]